MTRESTVDLLVLHAVRIIGFADTPAVARRYGLDPDETSEHLLDAQARGWVARAAFADLQGWSLTAAGRVENERQLAAEVAQAGCAAEIGAVYRAFLPLNGRLQQACTRWQLKPTAADPLGANDHSDSAWDKGVLDELTAVDEGLAPLENRLTDRLRRFAGYHRRFSTARQRAQAGDGRWVDRTDIDSCHRVWFELHEDLIATLGIDRTTQP